MSHEQNRHRSLLQVAALLLPFAASATMAQVLAHPGWTRSNFAAQPWYQRAVFYEVRSSDFAAAPDFKALANRLDAMQSTGIDAVIVTPPALPSIGGASPETSAAQAIAAQAELDAFDNFTRQATARGIRVLVALPAAHPDADLSGRTRFWLTRGVAGLRLEIPPGTSPQDRDAIATSARSLAASIAGQRIVLVDGDESSAVTQAASPRKASSRHAAPAITTPQLNVITLSSPLTAAALRPQLAHALGTSNTLFDTRPRDSDAPDILARVLATLALTGNNAALADPAQPLVLPATQPLPEPVDDSVKPAPAPIPPQPPPGVYLPYVPYVPPQRPQKKVAPPPAPADPLTVFYARLAALHHSNLALRTGSKIVLDFDAQNVLVWVARPASPTPQNPPVIVLCNLSGQSVELSIADAIKKLNLHGFFLRTLLRSDDALGAQDLEAVKLAPYGVFIGELKR